MHRLSQGGADRVGVLLANGLAEAGIPVRLSLLRDGGEGEAQLRDLLDPRVALGCAGSPIGSRHLELVRGRAFIRAEVAAFSPSLVLASSNNMGLVTGLAVGRSRLGPRRAMKVTNPVVRPQDRGALRTFYRRKLYGFVFGRYDRILTLTEAERQTLTALYPAYRSRFTTVPNAYISDDMRPRRVPREANGTRSVLALARMMPQKRLDVLISAFAALARQDCRLTILGDGPLRPRLEQQVMALGIADRVDMPGFVEDVLPWLHRADVVALSSDYEGLPAVALEALACNVPVVTTDCFDGVGEIIGINAACAVVPRGDVFALARALGSSLDCTPAERRNLQAIAAPYSIGASVAAHIAVLEPLIRDQQANAAQRDCVNSSSPSSGRLQ